MQEVEQDFTSLTRVRDDFLPLNLDNSLFDLVTHPVKTFSKKN